MGSFDFGTGEERDKDILLEINKLKDKFEELNSNFTTQEQTMSKFSVSLDNLNTSFQKLTSVLERAEQIMQTDNSDSQIKTLLEQNKQVAHGVIAVADLIKQQQKDMLSLREMAEHKLNNMKIQSAPQQSIQEMKLPESSIESTPRQSYEQPKQFTPPQVEDLSSERTVEPDYIGQPNVINQRIQEEFDATAPTRMEKPAEPINPTPVEPPKFDSDEEVLPPTTEFINDDDPEPPAQPVNENTIPPPPQSKGLFSKFKK